ncbi:MAG: hypothetical protein FWH27_04000 [Planctomycetaceae bacterium]|nr:hypothetical protein [Planctomycetaceae bacterium]
MDKFVIISAVYKDKSPENKRLHYVTFENERWDNFIFRDQLIKIIEQNPKKVFVKIEGNEYNVFDFDFGEGKVVRFNGSCGNGDDLGNVSRGYAGKDLEKIELINKYALELIQNGSINQRVISAFECMSLPHYGYVEKHIASGSLKKVQGHYAYYGYTGNARSLSNFRHEVERCWRKHLERRNRNKDMTWNRFRQILKQHPLPFPKIVHKGKLNEDT